MNPDKHLIELSEAVTIVIKLFGGWAAGKIYDRLELRKMSQEKSFQEINK